MGGAMGTLSKGEVKQKVKSAVPVKKTPIPKTILGESWDNQVSLPQDLAPIIFQYTGGEFEANHPDQYDYSSFKILNHNRKDIEQISAQDVAQVAASHILLANGEEVMKLVRANPAILHCRIPVVIDPVKRTLTLSVMKKIQKLNPEVTTVDSLFEMMPIVRYENKTLLQIAVAEGFFNYRTDLNDYGLVEQLMRYLSPKDIRQQLQEQLPLNWKEITNTRLQPYRDAITKFIASVKEMDIPVNATYQTLVNEGLFDDIANEFHTAIVTADNQIIDKGLRLTPILLHEAWSLLSEAFCNRYALNLPKANVCAIVICGTLNVLTPACDAHLFQSGLFTRPIGDEELYYLSMMDIGSFCCNKQGRIISDVQNLNVEDEIRFLGDLCIEKDKVIHHKLNALLEEKHQETSLPQQTTTKKSRFFKSAPVKLTNNQARPLVQAFENALENLLAYGQYSPETRQQLIDLIHITESMGDRDRIRQKIRPELFKQLSEQLISAPSVQYELKVLIEQHQQAFDWLLEHIRDEGRSAAPHF